MVARGQEASVDGDVRRSKAGFAGPQEQAQGTAFRGRAEIEQSDRLIDLHQPGQMFIRTEMRNGTLRAHCEQLCRAPHIPKAHGRIPGNAQHHITSRIEARLRDRLLMILKRKQELPRIDIPKTNLSVVARASEPTAIRMTVETANGSGILQHAPQMPRFDILDTHERIFRAGDGLPAAVVAEGGPRITQRAQIGTP
jgi:hypothetical protein